MKAHTIKINQRHGKKLIEENYFHYLDIFSKCLCVSLIYFSTEEDPVLESTIMENSHYNSVLLDMTHRHKSGHNILKDIGFDTSLNIFLDLQLYLEMFVKEKHNKALTNIYCLTINEDFEVVVVIKQLGKRYAF